GAARVSHGTRIRLLLPAVLAAVLLVPASPLRAGNPTLTADVGAGDGFTIALVDANGDPVTTLAAGTYTIVVHDHSAFHNFHLHGPGLDRSTDVGFVGD